ncbi:MAG TPA: PQQ-binding-like beta-propeller repeat protein [Gemmatimonadaceae bacterium]|nr:PQQ-binding-like beta-propeller repeat protein [Gemmatimonadaceae bacterium]
MMLRSHQQFFACRHFATVALLLAIPLAACGSSGTEPPPDADILWSTAAPGLGAPAADGDAVYFGTMQNEVVALDRATGEVRWRSATSSGLPQNLGGTNVVLAGSVVAFGDRDVVGFDRSTGERRWIFTGIDSLTFVGGMPGLFLLATDGSRIFAGSSNGHAYAINAADGSTAWTTQVGDQLGQSVQDAYVSGGTVYYTIRGALPSSADDVVALDAATGEVIWRYSTVAASPDDLFPLGPVAVSGSTVAFGDIDGSIHAVNATTGEVLWDAPAAAGEEGKRRGRWLVALGDELLAIGGGGDITALDPTTGDERWSNRASTIGAFGPIGTDGDTIYLLFNGDRQLGAYDASTGEELWLISPPGGAQRFGGLPLAASDTLFVPTTSALLALRQQR